MYRLRWELLLARICFAALLTGIGAAVRPFGLDAGPGAACGFGVAIFVLLWERRLRRAAPGAIAFGLGGAFAGGILGLVLVAMSGDQGQFFRIIVPVAGAYLGLLIGSAQSHAFRFGRFDSKGSGGGMGKILDTSVIIDGRIADIAESGFLEGRLIVPQFVLHELQTVADSSDTAKRNRGRRGLDLVRRLQKMPTIYLEISNEDFPGVKEVDRKLIELAKARTAKIVTNDFNLNKLAQVQGVSVLNTNELANALKPVVLPGETMRVFISKEGKEYNQGVAYLDDGTMVVVDNARRLISKTVDITVTSVLQTTAGKMIFGKYDERQQPAGERRAAGAAGAD
ncbi:MAG TPA: PIN domain-containing protein [Bryobacteraceae bacterium]